MSERILITAGADSIGSHLVGRYEQVGAAHPVALGGDNFDWRPL